MTVRRVVVTGLGVVCPLGREVEGAWSRLVGGGHGLVRLVGQEYDRLPCRVAARVQGTWEGATKREEKNIGQATLYALEAGKQALDHANWTPQEEEERRSTGVCIGVGMVDMPHIVETSKALDTSYSRVTPFFIPRILPNMAAGHLSMKYSFRGPNHTVSTACATGSHAIGDAFRFVRSGDAEVMLCGATEASISPLAIAGFSRIRALSTSFNDTPEKASRPFDGARDGFVMGEGAALLVLEEMGHALRRGANIYAEILGYGLSADASHITAPHEDGVGAILAMERAMADAKVRPTDITYINAHATSTPLGDAIELKSIKKLFKEHCKHLRISSTKGAHGHLLGAAGNLESLFTVLACNRAVIPPTINLENACEEVGDLNCVANVKQDWQAERRIALKNSFGFGGTNACLCISEFVK